jgi:hypothetical protein
VVERKNRTLQESTRVMLHTKHLPYHFWAEAMNTACYIHNRVTIRKGTSFTLYELWKERKPTVKHFHVFGCKCYILVDREQRRKMDPKSEEGIFLGYSTNSRAYRVFNSRTKVVMESINVVINDSGIDKVNSEVEYADVVDDVETSEHQMAVPEVEKNSVSGEGEINSEPTPSSKGPSIRVQKNHPKELIIGNLDQGITTKRSNDVITNSCFVSTFEPSLN